MGKWRVVMDRRLSGQCLCPWQVHSIRWFYDVLLEKMGGGLLNPASTSTFKKLMKALSFLMGQRRAYVPNALTREVVEAVCRVVRVDWLEEMQAASLLVGDLVWGGRAADLYLTDWAELVFELEKEARTAAARVIGLTWRRLQTKNDRLGRKDAPKPCGGRVRLGRPQGKRAGLNMLPPGPADPPRPAPQLQSERPRYLALKKRGLEILDRLICSITRVLGAARRLVERVMSQRGGSAAPAGYCKDRRQ